MCLVRRLGEAGVIDVRGAEVTILDAERLEDLAFGETDAI